MSGPFRVGSGFPGHYRDADTGVVLARRQALVVFAALAVCWSGCYGRGQGARRETSNLKPYGYKAEPLFRTAQLDALRVPIPTLADAEYVNDDQICATCHETYV